MTEHQAVTISDQRLGIYGVWTRALKQISEARGSVMHMLRRDDPWFEGFGEVYFSTIKAGAVKAWKRHKLMKQNLAVPCGGVQFVLYDDRPDSPTKGEFSDIVMGPGNYRLLHIPPLVWYGFKGIAKEDSLIVNCATLVHDPNETERLASDSQQIPYVW